MIKMPSVLVDYFPLRGGLNLVTPPLSMPSGQCKDAVNYEADIDGGYRRIAGYERYSGMPEPSAATYSTLMVTYSGTVSVGQFINGQTSGATAYVIAKDLANIYVTKITGTFSIGENIRVGAAIVAVLNATAASGAPDAKTDAKYLNLAADAYRADIQIVPGEGAVNCVFRYKGTVYAIRNKAGLLEAGLYKASITGWQPVPLGHEIYFTNANASVNEGDTLTRGGATALVTRVVVQTGSLASGVNTGKLILTNIVGTFTAGAATSTGGGTLTLSGGAIENKLPINGKYEFVIAGFTGAANSSRVYAVNGVGRAFEFDGSVFVFIDTGLVNDKPTRVAFHNNSLAVAYEGSVFIGDVGEPYRFSGISGAAEFAMGDLVTGILSLVGSNATQSLAIFTTNKTSILYGSSSADYQLVTLNFEAGGLPRTMQTLGDAYVFDVQGVRQLQASQRFGNFEQAQITRFIRPFITQRSTKASASCIVRSKDQYRLLFQDQYALYITFSNEQVMGIMPIKYGHAMACMISQESDTGEEFIFAGGTNGYVYRMEKGTSFDGDPIESSITMAFSYQKGPRTRKRYRKAVYEFTGNGYCEFEAGYDLGYGSADISAGEVQNLVSPTVPVFWDSFTWDAFTWDGRSLLPIEQEITGTAENLSLIIRSTSDEYPPFTVNSAMIHYTPRRNLR